VIKIRPAASPADCAFLAHATIGMDIRPSVSRIALAAGPESRPEGEAPCEFKRFAVHYSFGRAPAHGCGQAL
jgi:hypothetical protein